MQSQLFEIFEKLQTARLAGAQPQDRMLDQVQIDLAKLLYEHDAYPYKIRKYLRENYGKSLPSH